jgi:muconolactone delta-isomerase
LPTVDDKASAGDPIPPRCAAIEVHVGELKQLFNSIDPSPFRNKDLDPRAEEFIVGWAKDLPRDVPLALVVDLDRPAGLPDEAAVLRDAIHEFFKQRAEAYRRNLRELFRRGRTSLLIGLTVLAGAVALGDFLGTLMKTSRIGDILRESLTIGGWVSMWRPLEVFLYDWWPIRNEARLSDRLAAMPVRIKYMNARSPDAWKADWPVVAPTGEHPNVER